MHRGLTKFDTLLLCSAVAIIGVAIGMHQQPKPTTEPPAPHPVESAVVPAPTPLPSSPPAVVWHDNLASALDDHEANGGMLAIILGTTGCEPCKRRVAEAKALTGSPFDWVYVLDTDPELDRLDIGEQTTFPTFWLVIGESISQAKPETLGLKAEL